MAKYTRTLYEAWEENEELGGIGWHRSGSLGLARDADTLLQVGDAYMPAIDSIECLVVLRKGVLGW